MTVRLLAYGSRDGGSEGRGQNIIKNTRMNMSKKNRNCIYAYMHFPEILEHIRENIMACSSFVQFQEGHMPHPKSFLYGLDSQPNNGRLNIATWSYLWPKMFLNITGDFGDLWPSAQSLRRFPFFLIMWKVKKHWRFRKNTENKINYVGQAN